MLRSKRVGRMRGRTGSKRREREVPGLRVFPGKVRSLQEGERPTPTRAVQYSGFGMTMRVLPERSMCDMLRNGQRTHYRVWEVSVCSTLCSAHV